LKSKTPIFFDDFFSKNILKIKRSVYKSQEFCIVRHGFGCMSQFDKLLFVSYSTNSVVRHKIRLCDTKFMTDLQFADRVLWAIFLRADFCGPTWQPWFPLGPPRQSYAGRATRCVCEKVAQNVVAQSVTCEKSMHAFYRGNK
jgi:hypothetical protein